MKHDRRKVFLALMLCLLFSSILLAQQTPDEKEPASVAGKWTIHSKGETGQTVTQSIEPKQNESTITGHFQGPEQSGDLEGTVTGRHIIFRTRTHAVFTFNGTVDGNTIEGTFEIRGKKGTWEARRADE